MMSTSASAAAAAAALTLQRRSAAIAATNHVALHLYYEQQQQQQRALSVQTSRRKFGARKVQGKQSCPSTIILQFRHRHPQHHFVLPRTTCRRAFSTQKQPCPFATLGTPEFVLPRTTRRRAFSTQKQPCPFATLGIPKESSTFADAKSAFLRLALQHHPDVSSSSSSASADNEDSAKSNKSNKAAKQRSTEAFVATRAAFESIVEGEDGIAVLRTGSSHFSSRTGGRGRHMSEAEFESWFYSETGHAVPFDLSTRHIDPAVLREVAKITEGMAPGGLDKGGLWEFAKTVREKAKTGEMPPLRVAEGGEKASGGGSRRRRRRR